MFDFYDKKCYDSCRKGDGTGPDVCVCVCVL